MIQQVAGALELAGAVDILGDEPPARPVARGGGGASLGHGLPSGRTQQIPPAIRQLPIGFGVFYSNPPAVAPAIGPKGPGAAGPEVGAFKQLTAKIKLQDPYRLERLTIPSDIAEFYVVLQLRVGKPNVLATANAVPARMFDETATYVLLGTDTGQQACLIALTVLNVASFNQRFTAGLVGLALT